jgi:hypothetical protein
MIIIGQAYKVKYIVQILINTTDCCCSIAGQVPSHVYVFFPSESPYIVAGNIAKYDFDFV